MYRPNFCVECGVHLQRKGWRAWVNKRFCDNCARRLGKANLARPLAAVAIIAITAFAFGRYLRPPPPPLIVQRSAGSPLSDLPLNLNDSAKPNNREARSRNSAEDSSGKQTVRTVDDAVYICGARTKKGTPCHRRVHFAGERCYQHKGMPAILPLEKLAVKP